MIRLLKALFLALSLASCAFVSAQTVIVDNNDGALTTTGVTSGTLSLTGSTLIGVQGLSAYGIPNDSATPPNSLGTFSFTSGPLTSGSFASTAALGPGGNLNFTFTSGLAAGVVFNGSFSSAQWIQGGTNSWTFIGTVMNGTFTLPGYAPTTIGTSASVNLTVTGAPPICSDTGCTFEDTGGTTNFMISSPLSPVTEPGSLMLLGSGLVGVGILARRKRSKPNVP